MPDWLEETIKTNQHAVEVMRKELKDVQIRLEAMSVKWSIIQWVSAAITSGAISMLYYFLKK